MASQIDMSRDDEKELIESIWLGKGPESMPSNFINVMKYFSQSKEDFFEEWKFNGEDHADYDLEYDSVFCICSHLIKKKFYVKNIVNSNILRLGSECIHKFYGGTSVEHDMEEYLKRTKVGGVRRWCGGCERNNIVEDAPSWHTMCKKCYKNGVTDTTSSTDEFFNRQCDTCSKYVIPKSEPEWKKQCSQCFKRGVVVEDVEGSRQCDSCSKYVIPKSEPEWKKQCSQCFKRGVVVEDVEGSRQCDGCLKHVIPKSEPEWKKQCSQCFKRGVVVEDVEGSRQCDGCLKHVIPKSEPEWKKQCPQCFKRVVVGQLEVVGDGMRQCENCLRYMISLSEPEWKKQCHSCFGYEQIAMGDVQTSIQFSSQVVMQVIPESNRQCESCSEYSISSSEPSWKKQCLSCFKSKRPIGNQMSGNQMSGNQMGGDNRRCEGCLKYTIPITDPAWKKRCYTCFKNKRG